MFLGARDNRGTPPEWCISQCGIMVYLSMRYTTGTSCNGWNHCGCKWSLCANGWGRNINTVSCLQWQPPQAQGAKVRTSISASRNGMQEQHATPTTTTSDQLRISTGAGRRMKNDLAACCVVISQCCVLLDSVSEHLTCNCQIPNPILYAFV